MSFIPVPVICGLIALVLSLALTPVIIKFATLKGFVVHPRKDRWHKKPTALLGGIGIFISFSLATLFVNYGHVNFPIYCAMLLMFGVGLVDDIKEVKPIIKMLAQIAASFGLIYSHIYFGGGLLGWIGIPLTFFWVIGITNAVNLLDNMDGLAGGISGIVAIVTGILALMNGNIHTAFMAFALAGAVIGFLVYNFKPARIFMGDSGSLFLGFALSYLSISIQSNTGSSSALLVLLIPLGLMVIPIMDTTLVTIKRLAAGRRIDQGGRDHTSHRLVALGLSERKAVLILYCISAVWGVLCVFMYQNQINNLLLCISLLAVGSVIFFIVLSKIKVYNESEEQLSYLRLRGMTIKNPNLTFRLLLNHKKLIIGVFTDILIICGSFLIASKAMRIPNERDYVVLGTFISIKIGAFYLSNFYYRIWRFIEIVEIASYFAVASAATIELFVIMYFKGKTGEFYNPYFFLFDFLLTFTGVVAVRFFYRWLSELISRERVAEKKVMIYGAGASGYLLVKEILQNHKHELKPVGWFDDDESKHNMFLYGYKIYGGKEQMLNICKKVKPDIILISTDAIDRISETSIKELLVDTPDITLGRFNLSLDYSFKTAKKKAPSPITSDTLQDSDGVTIPAALNTPLKQSV